MTAYEDTVELTGKGNVENNAELLASVELTGKGASAIESGGLSFQALVELIGKGNVPSLKFSGSYADWQYRKAITLSNGGGALSTYQKLITLTTANFDYSKCKNDGGDIRFTASGAETALPYWIEDWNYNGDSKIWVKVDSIPGGSNACLYVFYGKNDATSESNGDNTFPIFFDDFPGSSLDTDKWDYAGTPSVSDSEVTLSGEGEYIKTKNTYTGGFASRTKFKGIGTGIRLFLGGFALAGNTAVNNDSTSALYYYSSWSDFYYNSGNGASYDAQTLNVALDADYHITDTKRTGSTDIFNIDDGSNVSGLYPTNLARYYRLYSHFAAGSLVVDWVLIRKYATPDPTNELGEEETGGDVNKLKAFSIHHPAIKSFEIIDTGIKEEQLSNLEDHISTVATRKNLDLAATAIKVITLADQEYTFPVQ